MDQVPPWIWALVILSGVGGVLYLAYKYFVEPGNIILRQYETIMEDIYKETKEFLESNAALEPPIYGLTSGQEIILKAKEDALERLRPDVEDILKSRQIDVDVWVVTAILSIVGVYAFKAALPYLKDLINSWRVKAEAHEMQSSWGHSHWIFELVSNDYAYAGKLNVAGAFYNTNIPSIYSVYTAPALTAGIDYYNTLIPTLIPGSMAWIVATNMLNYMTYEVSAATGIMAVMHVWWLPPLI